MPVGDKSKRVKRLLGDSMTTHLSSGNPRQRRCRNNTRQHHTPTTQREQLQTGVRVLTGMNVTNLALILVYLVNGEIAISFLQHNGSDRPISFPHPTPCWRQVSYLLSIVIQPHKYHRQATQSFIQCIITVRPVSDCCPHPPHTTRRVLHCVQVHFQKYPCKISDVAWQVVNLCEFVMYLSLKDLSLKGQTDDCGCQEKLRIFTKYLTTIVIENPSSFHDVGWIVPPCHRTPHNKGAH